jgi:hypothetical protein
MRHRISACGDGSKEGDDIDKLSGCSTAPSYRQQVEKKKGVGVEKTK